MADVQRAGRVGRDELDQHRAGRCDGSAAEALARGEHLAHDLLLGRGLSLMLMKPGPAMSIASTQRRTAGCARSAAISAGATSRGFFFSGLASCMRRGAGEVAMRRQLGRFEGRGQIAARAYLGDGFGERARQRLLGLDHRRRILRAALVATGQGARVQRRVIFAPEWPRRARARRRHRERRCVILGRRFGAPPAHVRSRLPCHPAARRRGCVAGADRQIPCRCASSAKARPARSSCAATTSAAATWRSSACALGRSRRPGRRPLLGALLRRRGGARRPAAAPERGADLRRGGRAGRAVPGDGVRRGVTLRRVSAAPTSCCRSS